MLDFSFGELVLVAFVAFFIVGPKEFPVIMRTLGRWAGQCKSITDEFRAGFHSAMQQHGVADIETDIATIREEMNFIRDQDGKLQRIYNISEYMEESKRPAKPPQVVSASSLAPHEREQEI